MNRRAVWRRRAEEDVIEAAGYIAVDSPSVAARFLDSVDETVRALLRHPRTGRLCEFLMPSLAGLRCRIVRGFGAWLVFYRQEDPGIEVIRVLHGARDIEAIFQKVDE